MHAKVAPRDIVTDTDMDIEDAIRLSLGSAFDWPVIGEERGGEIPSDGAYWLVDPICGTRNFALEIPLFSVNLALVEAGEPTVAVVGDGSSRDTLLAEVGNGVWSTADGHLGQLSTSSASSVVDFEAWPKAGAERDRAAAALASVVAADRWDVRCLSTTLALAYVARGRMAGCVMFDTPGPEHTTAGVLLVREAGGRVTDVSGKDWSLRSVGIVASAGDETHEELFGFWAAQDIERD